MGFAIPYLINGQEKNYIPDYIVRLRLPERQKRRVQSTETRAEKTALPKELLNRCRELRRSATNAENLLWQLLRDRRLCDFKFRRQHPLGGYILDFYCHEAQLDVEVDGGGHAEDVQAHHDAQRTHELEELGVRVIRFWNNEVLNETGKVLEEILAQVSNTPNNSLTPTLSLREREFMDEY